MDLKQGRRKKTQGSVTNSQGKRRRTFAGGALGRGTGTRLSAGTALSGPASCQPSPSPMHRLLQQAPKVLLGGESQPPASFSAVEENVNSACDFVHLSLCWYDILLQIRFVQHRKDGVLLLFK